MRARKIRIVMGNLNVHKESSLYERFSPEVARQLVRQIEFHYTPKHGSWLNMAEVEISDSLREKFRIQIHKIPVSPIGQYFTKRCYFCEISVEEYESALSLAI